MTVGKATELADGDIRAFDVRGRRIALVNAGGRYHAFDDTCTHAACSLAEGELEGGTVVCPCHLGAYELETGAVVGGPPPAPVAVHEVRVEGEELRVKVEEDLPLGV